MKDKLMNALTLLAVIAAVAVTLFRGSAEPEPVILPLTKPVQALPTPHPAESYRKTREDTRQKEQEALTALLQSGSASTETRALAEKQLSALAKNSEIELAAEAALAARGYEYALCVARSGEAYVFAAGEVNQRDAALLLDIIQTASGLPREKIRITDHAF